MYQSLLHAGPVLDNKFQQHFLLGLRHLRCGSPHQAQAELRRALSLFAQSCVGSVSPGQGDDDKSLSHREHGSNSITMALAHSLWEANEVVETSRPLPALSHAVAPGPPEVSAVVAEQVRKLLNSVTVKTEEEKADVAECLARLTFDQGRVDDAKRLYEELLKENPWFEDAWNNLGVVHLLSDQFEEATRMFQHILCAGGAAQHADTVANYSVLLTKQDKLQEAAELLQTTMVRINTHGPLWNSLGVVRELMGDMDDARLCYDKARQCETLEPASGWSVRFNLANHLIKHARSCSDETGAERLKAAEELLESIAPRGQETAATWISKARLLLARSERSTDASELATLRAKAKAALTHAINLEPSNRVAWNQLGLLAMSREDFAEAQLYFKNITSRLAPEAAAPVLSNLGVALQLAARPDDAELAYKAALEACPTSNEARNNLGNLYRQTGRLQHASACYAEAIQQDPAFAVAFNNLALVCIQEKRLAEAASMLAAALGADPELPSARSNQLKLEALVKRQGGASLADATQAAVRLAELRRMQQQDPAARDLVEWALQKAPQLKEALALRRALTQAERAAACDFT